MHVDSKVSRDPSSASAASAERGGLLSFIGPEARWFKLVVMLLVGLVLMLRGGDHFWHPQFWVEDGTVAFQDAYNLSFWQSVTKPYAGGYYLLATRLLAELALVINIEYAPVMFMIMGFVVATLCCSLPARGFLLADAVGPAQSACLFDADSAAGHLGDCAALRAAPVVSGVALFFDDADDPPRTRRGAVVYLVGWLLCGFSTPQTLVFLPCLAVRAWFVPGQRRLLAGAALAGPVWAIAVVLVYRHAPADVSTGAVERANCASQHVRGQSSRHVVRGIRSSLRWFCEKPIADYLLSLVITVRSVRRGAVDFMVSSGAAVRAVMPSRLFRVLHDRADRAGVLPTRGGDDRPQHSHILGRRSIFRAASGISRAAPCLVDDDDTRPGSPSVCRAYRSHPNDRLRRLGRFLRSVCSYRPAVAQPGAENQGGEASGAEQVVRVPSNPLAFGALLEFHSPASPALTMKRGDGVIEYAGSDGATKAPVTTDDIFLVAGWAFNVASNAPFEEVLVVDKASGAVLARTRLHGTRPDVAQAKANDHLLWSGWRVAVRADRLGEGRHVLRAYTCDICDGSASEAYLLAGEATVDIGRGLRGPAHPKETTAGVIDHVGARGRPMTAFRTSDTIEMVGWALNSARSAPADSVVFVDEDSGLLVAYTGTGDDRPDVAQAYGNVGLAHAGWKISFPANQLVQGSHRIRLYVFERGTRQLLPTDSMRPSKSASTTNLKPMTWRWWRLHLTDPTRQRTGMRPSASVLFVAALPMLLVGMRVIQAGINLPFFDQWFPGSSVDVALASHARNLHPAALWQPVFEHRIVFTHLTTALLAGFGQWNVKAEMLISVALAGMALFVILGRLQALSTRPLPVWLGALLSGLMFGLRQQNNWLWSFGTSWYFALLFVTLTLGLLSAPGGGAGRLFLAAASAEAASLSLGSGLLAWPLGFFLLLPGRPGGWPRCSAGPPLRGSDPRAVQRAEHPARSEQRAPLPWALGRLRFVLAFLGAPLLPDRPYLLDDPWRSGPWRCLRFWGWSLRCDAPASLPSASPSCSGSLRTPVAPPRSSRSATAHRRPTHCSGATRRMGR